VFCMHPPKGLVAFSKPWDVFVEHAGDFPEVGRPRHCCTLRASFSAIVSYENQHVKESNVKLRKCEHLKVEIRKEGAK
jgi:hypothetical protein